MAAVAERVGESSTDSPYISRLGNVSELGISPADLGLPFDPVITIEDLNPEIPGAKTVEEARELYREFGAVKFDDNFEMVGTGERLGDSAAKLNRDTARALRRHSLDPRVVIPKAFKAYNGTPRLMSVIPFPRVKSHFKHAIAWQERFLSTVQAINGDSETIISQDPDEGSVINVQTMRPTTLPQRLLRAIVHKPRAQQTQAHGGHKDRVGPTVLVYGENVGKDGDTVLVLGYAAACERFDLDEHADFNGNLAKILAKDSTALKFRRHRIEKGTVMMIDSTRTHLITAKSSADVEETLRGGYKPISAWHDPQTKVVRLVHNLAYEDSFCQAMDRHAQDIEAAVAQAGGLKGQQIGRSAIVLSMLDELGFDRQEHQRERRAIIDAMIGRQSAIDLYSTEQVRGPRAWKRARAVAKRAIWAAFSLN